MYRQIIDWFNPSTKIYCIYNCAGMAYNNTNFYIKAINNLKNQKFRKFEVIVSACLLENHQIEKIIKECPGIHICRTQERVPVGVTFNLAIQKSVEKLGLPEAGFLYIDSGIDFAEDKLVLKKLYKLFKSKTYGLLHPQSQETLQLPVQKTPYIINLGKSVPLVCGLFSTKWYKTYGKILPDIFVGMYMEETFPFMASAIESKIAISPEVKVNHKAEMDGTALVAECIPWQRQGEKLWFHPYIISKEDFINRLTGIQAKEIGLGYTEALNISMHNPRLFNENGFSLFPLSLQDYIKNNLFLKKNELDYNKLNHEWI